MAKITIEELSDSLKEHLNELGLTEEQVNSLVQNKLGDLSNLETANKNSIVEAINELFQSANSGKELIASAIGNPLITGDSTFNAMSEAILELKKESENETDPKEVLYNMMIEDGYNEATSEMTVDELIDLLDRSGIEIGDIKQIACGENYAYILKNDGSVYSCGNNNRGQLGLGDTTRRTTFTQVTTNINNDVKQVTCGSNHIFIIKNDGSLWSCGYNYYGQLGLGDDTERTTFTQVTTNINNDVNQVACGLYHTYIIKNDGSVWSCGNNNDGQLGLNDNNTRTTFTQVTTNINNDVKQISCGTYHAFILKNDGSVWSCGYNTYGQLGLNDNNTRTTFTQVTTNINNDVKQISCGNNHTVILKNDGSSLWSCGLNDYGQLGLGDTTNKITFTQVKMHIDIKQIACGDNHTVVLENDGSVWSCGRNNYGQLGTPVVTEYNNVFNQVTTNINNDVTQIACGKEYTYIIKNDGSLWVCGNNYYGQLGLGDDTTNRTTFTNTNFTTGVSEHDIDKLALYNYLLSNDIEVTEDMDIESMLNLLVDDNTNNMTLGYATGEGSVTFIVTSESKPRNATLDKPFGFTPTHIILVFDNGAILTNETTSDNPLVLDEENYVYIDSMTSDTLTFSSFSGMNQYSHDFTYYAFDANSSSSESGTGSNILSYDTLELSSSDLFIPTNSDSDYYHYSLGSYNMDDVYLVFADTNAIEDDIGYMQYYYSLYFSPDSSAGFGSIFLGHDSGGEVESVTQMSAAARIPIMKTTDRLLKNKLVVFYRAGAVSNAFSQSLLNTETATYQNIEYHTFDLDSLSFDFDYILFSLPVNNGDGDSSNIYSMYDRNSKKCCIMAYGYDNYSYKIDNVPSNAIPIRPTNRYSGVFVSYTGFVANENGGDIYTSSSIDKINNIISLL